MFLLISSSRIVVEILVLLSNGSNLAKGERNAQHNEANITGDGQRAPRSFAYLSTCCIVAMTAHSIRYLDDSFKLTY